MMVYKRFAPSPSLPIFSATWRFARFSHNLCRHAPASLWRNFTGKTRCSAPCRSLEHITPDAPRSSSSTIEVTCVFPQQSEILYQALHNAGVDTTLYLIPEGTHGFRGVSESEQEKVIRIASTFFDSHLRP